MFSEGHRLRSLGSEAYTSAMEEGCMRRAPRTWFFNDFMKGGAGEKRPPRGSRKECLFFWKRKVTRISRMGHRVTGLFVLALGSLVLSFSDAVEAVSEPMGSANRAMAGPEGFEPSTIPRTSRLDPSFRLRASALESAALPG